MKTIQLTQGQVTIVDDDDFESVSKYKWYAQRRRNTFYAVRHIKSGDKYINLQLHRFLMNPKTGMCVDHRDCNGLNNQRMNLRVCTHAENTRNLRHKRKNAAKYRGIYMSSSGKYIAKVRFNYKQYNSRSFPTSDEAITAHREMIRSLHGEFSAV